MVPVKLTVKHQELGSPADIGFTLLAQPMTLEQVRGGGRHASLGCICLVTLYPHHRPFHLPFPQSGPEPLPSPYSPSLRPWTTVGCGSQSTGRARWSPSTRPLWRCLASTRSYCWASPWTCLWTCSARRCLQALPRGSIRGEGPSGPPRPPGPASSTQCWSSWRRSEPGWASVTTGYANDTGLGRCWGLCLWIIFCVTRAGIVKLKMCVFLSPHSCLTHLPRLPSSPQDHFLPGRVVARGGHQPSAPADLPLTPRQHHPGEG